MRFFIFTILLSLSIVSVYAETTKGKEQYRWELEQKGWLYGCAPANWSLSEPVRGGLGYAVMKGRNDIVELEMLAGYNPNDCKGAVGQAVYRKNPEAVKILLNYGLDPNTKFGGSPIIFSSIYYKCPECVEVLINNGVDVNLEAFGYNPLNYALKKKQYNIAEMLVKAGAKPDEKTLKLVKKSKNQQIKALFN